MHFFDHEVRYILGRAWYRSHWRSARSRRTLGIDGSGTYLHSPLAALRIGAGLSSVDTTLLLVLRDPGERAVRRWRELARRPEYTRDTTFDSKVLASAVHEPH